MIMPKLYGRLGNQCFQAAAAIAHARAMDTNWAIPRITNDQRTWPNFFLHTVPRSNITMYSTRDYYKESRHCYDPLPTNHDLTIDGYFQSEKYWPEYNTKYEIGEALGFHCSYKDYVAIHVRRGDYVTDYADKHPPLDLDYYSQAISKYIDSGYENFKFYSDDVEWCKSNFKGGMFSYSIIKNPLDDMRDMYNASGFIISNSTFSLFPALLRLDNPEVIAPKESRWYGKGNSHLETIDLMPDRFIKI
jgi:hypothetical protein